MASTVSLNLRVTTPGARKGEKRRPTGPEMITQLVVGHGDSELFATLTNCVTVEEQVRVVKAVSPASKAVGQIQTMKDPLFFQFFESLPPEPPEEDLIQTVRGFFLLPKSSALRKVIVNCQARTVDEHRRRLTGHFRRFLRKAVEDTDGGDGSVSLPDNVLSISECGQDHPAKDAVKAEATLLAPAILVRNLISGAGISVFDNVPREII